MYAHLCIILISQACRTIALKPALAEVQPPRGYNRHGEVYEQKLNKSLRETL